MKILWITNLALPEAFQILNKPPSPYGGWLTQQSQFLSNTENVSLTVAFPYSGKFENLVLEGEKINYYPFKPIKRINYNNKSFFENLFEIINPDLVHIHGTEFQHSYQAVLACKKMNLTAAVSIQGLVSVIEKHMYSNLPFSAIYGNTLKNIIRKDNVFNQRKLFKKRGSLEIKALQNVQHIIGRTSWDFALVKQINPTANYYQINDSLRSLFYQSRWSLESCEKYSIFLSQGNYPIKGLHNLIEAMPIIKDQFPDFKVYVAGQNITSESTFIEKIKLTYYGKYLNRLIKKNRVTENIIFIGELKEEQMVNQFLKSHVFVCPSSIENNPNSLGEAMLMGVPCVASYVGGIPDMLMHKEEGFIYQADAPYMLAHFINEIFKSPQTAEEFSKKSRLRASKVHNIEKNKKDLYKIYEEIIAKNSK